MDNLPKSCREIAEIDAQNEIFDIHGLPHELLLYVFGFLDLNSWKVARRVSEHWNLCLCQVALTSGFKLKFHRCEIDFTKSPMSIFRRTKSFFPIVEITNWIKWDSEDALFDLCRFIGAETIKLYIDWKEINLEKIKLSKKVLWNFPKLQSIECPAELFLKNQTPSNVNKLTFTDVKTFMSPEEIRKLEALLSDETKQVFLKSVKIIQFPKESEQEFIEIEESLMKFVSDIEASTFITSKIDLKETRLIKFSDVVILDSYKFYKKREILNNLHKLTKLEEIEVEDCAPLHELIDRSGVKRLILYRNNPCNCMLKFPNLKWLTVFNLSTDFVWFLQFNPALEEIGLYFCEVNLEPLIRLPVKSLKNLMNLRVLHLDEVNENLNWNLLPEKLPKLPKLVDLKLKIKDSQKFEDFCDFFSLMPNLEKFEFKTFKDFKVTDLEKVFKLLPNLTKIDMLVTAKEYFDEEIYKKLIIPHIIKLKSCKILLTLSDVEANGCKDFLYGKRNRDLDAYFSDHFLF